jgi:hemerythrin-like metal-binding protein
MEISSRTEEYEARVARIESQHTRIWGFLVELYEAAAKGELPAGEICRIRDEMITVIIEHISCEEELMQASGYPGFADHKREHDEIKRTTLEMKESVGHEREDVLRAYSYGMERMSEHFRNYDMACMAYFESQGKE